MSSIGSICKTLVFLALYCTTAHAYPQNPFVIRLEIPAPQDSAGGIIVADVNNDGRMDYLVTVPGHIAAYANDGRKLWVLKTDVVVSGSSENEGLPGHNGPGVAAGDMDGDGRCEVLFLMKDSVLHILDGSTGREKATAQPRHPDEAERWEVAMLADFRGTKVFDYSMDEVAPSGWTPRGVEILHTIDWTGGPRQLACATERHESGDVCLFEPLTGRFVEHIPEKADRLYVADVTGDWREEIIVLNGSELHVYYNEASNPRPQHKRLWTDRNYRRLKQCHNYYSP
jgi:hypothetical protein